MSLPPGKKWVIAEGEEVHLWVGGRAETLFLRHAKTAADPYWAFQRADGRTLYLEQIERIERTNSPDAVAPSEDIKT